MTAFPPSLIGERGSVPGEGGGAMLRVTLYGGECDGLTQEVNAPERPSVFFAVPLTVMEEIRQTVRSPLAQKVAYEKSRTLAYVFDGVRTVDDEVVYCYRRSPEKDKPTSL